MQRWNVRVGGRVPPKLSSVRLFESTAKTTSSATDAVAASSAMLVVVTVGFGHGFGGRICEGEHTRSKLKPLDVERETRLGKYHDGDGLYLIVKGATSTNWLYRHSKGGK